MGNTPDDEDQLTKAAQCFGLDISESLQNPEQQPQPESDSDCEVWPEHWDALRLFLACQSQRELSLGGMGGMLLMPARSVNVQQELVWLGLARKRHALVVDQFRHIEREALGLLNARAACQSA